MKNPSFQENEGFFLFSCIKAQLLQKIGLILNVTSIHQGGCS